MSHSVASLAGMQGKIRETDPAEAVRCLMLFALLAVDRARFLFSREMIVRYIAAIVFQRTEDNIKLQRFQCTFRGTFQLAEEVQRKLGFFVVK